ncbi:hypothetical protein [Flaviaesturariibacter terrae]
MKRTSLSIAAIAALSLTACKKKDSNSNPGTGGSTTMYLKKLTETENGVSKVYNFTYDSQHRLLQFKTTDNSETTVFSYDAAGNLVTVDESETEFHNIYSYTYSNGKPVSGTFKSWKHIPGQPDELYEDDQLTYTVTANRVTGMHLEMLLDADSDDFTFSYDANGEVTQVSDNAGMYKASFTYGNHKTAFPSISAWVLDQAGFSLHFYARHELTSVAYDFPGTVLDQTESTSYTFNAAGYPATATKGTQVSTFEYE